MFNIKMPATQAVMGRKLFYNVQVPVTLITKIFSDYLSIKRGGEKVTFKSKQRLLNHKKIRELAEYMKHDGYIIPPLVGMLEGVKRFTRFSEEVSSAGFNLGTLEVELESCIFHLADGQHRLNAIAFCLATDPEWEFHTSHIPVTFFCSPSDDYSRQVFADINRNCTKPGASINILFDQREESAKLTKEIVQSVPFLYKNTELSANNLTSKSSKVLTLSTVYNAVKNGNVYIPGDVDFELKKAVYIDLFNRAFSALSHWSVISEEFPAKCFRDRYILGHGTGQLALFSLMFDLNVIGQLNRLCELDEFDWSKDNKDLLLRSYSVEGKVLRSKKAIKRTVCLLKQFLNIELSSLEQGIENELTEIKELQYGE